MPKWIDKLFSHHHDKAYKRLETSAVKIVKINGVDMSITDAMLFLKSIQPPKKKKKSNQNHSPPSVENLAPPLPTLYEFTCLQCGNRHKTTYQPATMERICYTCKYPYRCHNCGKGMKTNNFRNCYDCNGRPTKKSYNVVKLP